jgi:hypothetical protein
MCHSETHRFFQAGLPAWTGRNLPSNAWSVDQRSQLPSRKSTLRYTSR